MFEAVVAGADKEERGGGGRLSSPMLVRDTFLCAEEEDLGFTDPPLGEEEDEFSDEEDEEAAEPAKPASAEPAPPAALGC